MASHQPPTDAGGGTGVDNIHIVEYKRVNKRPTKKGDIVKHTLNIENVLTSF